MALSEEQKKAAETFDRNVLLLASAGTGKTFTLANKVAEGIKRGIKPEEILLLTFTVKARDEIKDDVLSYAGETAVNAFTVHGFCYELIKEYGYKTRAENLISVIDETDAGELQKRLADGMIAEKTDDKEKLTVLPDKQFSRIVSAVKAEKDALGFSFSSDDGYAAAIASLAEKGDFAELFSFRKYGAQITDYNFYNLIQTRGREYFTRYADALSSSALADFDDLLYYAKELIARGEVATDRYKLVVLDEVQDVGTTEYSIVEKFFPSAVVMLCGDENQTIYGWRGSDPKKIIADFKAKYAPVEIRLTQNRRSTEVLRVAADGFLKNAFGGGVTVTTEPDGEKIEVCGCSSQEDEAKKIFSIIGNYDGDRTDICVMTRSNRYAANLYKSLTRLNSSLPKAERIPFFTADADHRLYKRPIVKDFTAFMRLVVNPSDVGALDRICRRFIKSVKTDLVAAIESYGAAGVSLGDFMRDDTYLHDDGFYSLIDAYEHGRLIVYDLETTGADTAVDEPVQISAVKFGAGREEQFNVFVLPEREISAGALATHGYDEKYIETHGGIKLNEAIRRFADFSSGCVLVGHNSSAFDDVIIKRLAERENIPLSVVGCYDTLVIAKTFFRHEKNYKLSTLCEKFGVVNDRAHDAFSDVTATKACLISVLQGYIIPATSVRKTVLASNASAFAGLHENLKRFSVETESGDAFALIKDISATYSIIDSSTPQADREAANDLYAAIKDIGEAPSPINALGEILSDAALSGSKLDSMIKKSKKTPIITIHQSKGCEFSTVILAGAGEDEIPSFPSKLSGNEEEEKRVFYVALTRAKKKLVITYKDKKAFGSSEYPSAPSPYIGLIPKICVKSDGGIS